MTQEYGKLHPSNLDDLFAGEVWRRNYIANQINKEKSLVEKELADFDKCLTTREEKRNVIKSKFPFTVVLYGAYISHDFAVRWCWRNFGPIDGKCDERGSEFPGCPLVLATEYLVNGWYFDANKNKVDWEEKAYKEVEDHDHVGIWKYFWLGKHGYDYGFSEFYFQNESDRDCFLAAIPNFNLGEL